MRRRGKDYAIAAGIARRLRPIIDVGSDVFLGLAHGECKRAGIPQTSLLILVVINRLAGDDETQTERGVRIARSRSLSEGVILRGSALGFHRSEAKTSHFLLFLIVHIRRFHAEQVSIFGRIFLVVASPDSVKAGPEKFGDIAS